MTLKPIPLGKQGFITPLVTIITLITLLIGGVVVYEYQKTKHKSNIPPYGGVQNPTTPPQGNVCTKEAKQCPDGSYVSRQGPKCEFAACPNQKEKQTSQSSVPADWKTYRNEKYGFEVRYPVDMSIKISDFSKLNRADGYLALYAIYDPSYNMPSKVGSQEQFNQIEKEYKSIRIRISKKTSGVDMDKNFFDALGRGSKIKQYRILVAGKTIDVYIVKLPVEPGMDIQRGPNLFTSFTNQEYYFAVDSHESQAKLAEDILSTFTFTR